MKEEILKFLKAQENYVSGEEMSTKLGVTRACVWKNIKKLQEEGYIIESSTKKGYRLIEVPNVVTKEELNGCIQTEYLGKNIKYYSEVDSTNEIAKELAKKGIKDGTVVVADVQLSGKGRLGRSWNSPKGVGIWMSLILKPDLMPQQASQITLVAGLSMCQAIAEVTGLDSKIKWPNDIVVNGKKVCGILTEMSAEVERINYVVVGIGVNVNNETFQEELPFASSLKIEGGKEYSRKEIAAKFLKIFEKYFTVYQADGDLKHIIEPYSKACITLGHKVKVTTNKEVKIGEAVSVDKDGSLEVLWESGQREKVFAGEVSVRGLYGYV